MDVFGALAIVLLAAVLAPLAALLSPLLKRDAVRSPGLAFASLVPLFVLAIFVLGGRGETAALGAAAATTPILPYVAALLAAPLLGAVAAWWDSGPDRAYPLVCVLLLLFAGLGLATGVWAMSIESGLPERPPFT